MLRYNIFDGDSYYAQFAQVTYKLLMSRRWITYADIMAEYLGKTLACNVSNCDHYGELKKAFRDIRNIIRGKVDPACFEEDGNNRNKRFRYIGKDNDPLAEMRNAKVISDLRQYWQFCQDSAGFFPTSWLEYFFEDSRDLLDIKVKRQRGEQVLSASLDRMLTNIELLPSLYVAIINKQVLSVKYQPYDQEEMNLIFHPHYLKEYNGRWHLFGHADDQCPDFGYNLALDRIVGKPGEVKKEYVEAPQDFYKKYQEIINDYTQEQNRATIEKTFEELMKLSHELTEEEKRYIREGFENDEQLSMYDVLMKDNLSKEDIKKLKVVAKELLEKIKIQLATMDHPFDKQETRASIIITIQDILWKELPESYSDESINYYRDAVYNYVSQHYGSVA